MVQSRYVHIYNKVREAFEHEQLFLQADLSLKSLSRIIGTNTVYLSRAINEGFGCNFTTLINSYRLEYIIKEAVQSEQTVEEISARLGFWSRSTLYDVFRLNTGLSPHKYIEKKKDESK